MAKIQSRQEELDERERIANAPIGSGILTPLMANQFRVSIDGNKLIMMQTLSVSFDIPEEVFEVVIQQPHGYGVELFQAIESISNRFNVPFSIDLMNGSEDATSSSITGFCKLIGHHFDLNYAKTEPAEHHLIFKYVRSAV